MAVYKIWYLKHNVLKQFSIIYFAIGIIFKLPLQGYHLLKETTVHFI